MTTKPLEREVITIKDCHFITGSRPHFEELLQMFPQILSPYRIGKPTGKKASGTPSRGKTEYLRTDLMAAIKAYKLNRNIPQQ